MFSAGARQTPGASPATVARTLALPRRCAGRSSALGFAFWGQYHPDRGAKLFPDGGLWALDASAARAGLVPRGERLPTAVSRAGRGRREGVTKASRGRGRRNPQDEVGRSLFRSSASTLVVIASDFVLDAVSWSVILVLAVPRTESQRLLLY